MSTLTEEQRKRIEANRLKALEIRKRKLAEAAALKATNISTDTRRVYSAPQTKTNSSNNASNLGGPASLSSASIINHNSLPTGSKIIKNNCVTKVFGSNLSSSNTNKPVIGSTFKSSPCNPCSASSSGLASNNWKRSSSNLSGVSNSFYGE